LPRLTQQFDGQYAVTPLLVRVSL